VLSVAERADGDHVLFSRFRDTMPNGVLDERLQNESGNRAVDHTRINLQFKSKPISKTSLLNGDVVLEKFNFPIDSDFLRSYLV
jgi:hypothetical protein